MNKRISRTYFSVVLMLIGIVSLNLGTPTYAAAIDEHKTEVAVSLERIIIPDKLPGMEPSSSKSFQSTTNQINSQKGTLLKTGSVLNRWPILGMIIVALVLLKYEKNRKKWKVEE